ncbi:MAG: alpha/beta hydrolase [Proteobacteria bacterium]|nr:alpha/beta hydrolase [Pseudomonadota bacterium]
MLNKSYEYYPCVNTDAETLACFAGATEGCFRYHPYLEKLTKHFNVILFNYPGIGGMEYEEDYTIEILAKKFLKVLDALNIETFHVMGHSMGGFVSQRLATQVPERVKRLVLVSTGFGSFAHTEAFYRMINFKEFGMKSVFSKYFVENHPEKVDEFIQDKKEKIENKFIVPRASLACIFAGSRFSSFGELNKIKAETLVIHGVDDYVTELKMGETVSKLIQNSRILKLQKIGHYPLIEDDSVIDNIIAFLTNEAEIGELASNSYTLSEDLLKMDKSFKVGVNSEEYTEVFKDIFIYKKYQKEEALHAYLNVVNSGAADNELYGIKSL